MSIDSQLGLWGELHVLRPHLLPALGAAKAILWRTAEKLFDTLELYGYRANSVAYGIAWLAESSKRRIDLERVWNEQRITPALCDALKAVCGAAHKHITSQDGNPGEASKRESCWSEFREKKLCEPREW